MDRPPIPHPPYFPIYPPEWNTQTEEYEEYEEHPPQQQSPEYVTAGFLKTVHIMEKLANQILTEYYESSTYLLSSPFAPAYARYIRTSRATETEIFLWVLYWKHWYNSTP